jgi:hypothetical protein
MSLSAGSIETLMELLEAKLGVVEIFDREDAREVKVLQRCREELTTCRAKGAGGTAAPARRRGRRKTAQAAPI